MPSLGCFSDQLIEVLARVLRVVISQYATRNKQFYKAMDLSMLFEQTPVKPARFIIVAVIVVVANLGATNFIAHENHRHANGQQGDRQEVLDLFVPKFLDRWIIGWTFNATIPALVVVCPISIMIVIRFIMFPVVGNKIVESKAIMTSDKVNTLFSFTLLVGIDIRASQQAVSDSRNSIALRAEEAAAVIPKSSVPFHPTIANEASDLIETSGIPCFCDELSTSEHRIGLNVPKNWRSSHALA
jgi:hypothetical protein